MDLPGQIRDLLSQLFVLPRELSIRLKEFEVLVGLRRGWLSKLHLEKLAALAAFQASLALRLLNDAVDAGLDTLGPC